MTAPNEEGEDLSEPLPPEWTLHDLQGMQVTLYGMQMSPPCCKLRLLLAFYRVPFASMSGKRPTGEYKKVPALDIGNRQLNDSFIIVKSLAPVLQGRPLTSDEVELERNMTFGLMVALEKDVAGNSGDLRSCGCTMGGGMGCALWTLSCCLARVGPSRFGAGVSQFLGKPVGSISEYGQMLRERLGSRDYLAGSEAGVVDASVFGMLSPFDVAECCCVAALLGPRGDPLHSWYTRMKEKTADISIF
eukprot:CAMPEP_0171254060 /NCGR_PEP_ID=MMETSP0790-20130122/52029_1 /TAXON_ID=2925 /ORGANISM="Alexandrium catenella, Strain OF101" /LENGTH=245 /DNA_ID=CAMNT_0011721915 /DNA_START=78 /DNA_END=815 /DNA_ORIENTATION=+